MHPTHLTYAEAGIVGLMQGITELFPVSSLGHAVLIPAVVGGQWATDLNVSKAESPYLAYIVGLHVATALAMIIFFWRDWLRIIGAFFGSLRHFIVPEPGTRRFEPQGTDQKLAWMIILATIPVGIAGLLLEHTFRTVFSRPLLTSSFLFVNGLILLAGERARRRGADAEMQQVAFDQQMAAERQKAAVAAGGHGPIGGGRHSSGQRAMKQEQASLAVQADQRLVSLSFLTRHRPRRDADPGAAARHQPGWHRHGQRHVPRAVPARRGPVLVPAVGSGHLGGRGAEDRRPDRAAGRRDPRAGDVRQRAGLARRLLRAQVPGPLPE